MEVVFLLIFVGINVFGVLVGVNVGLTMDGVYGVAGVMLFHRSGYRAEGIGIGTGWVPDYTVGDSKE